MDEDEGGPVKNMDEERRWVDRRVEGGTFVEAIGMDEDEG
jgi:hypothetical protein